jgi:Ras-related protein Rab-7L1
MFKIIVVGEQSVGKTSILNAYVYGIFKENQKSTVGCEFQVKLLPSTNDREEIKLQLWDIAGQERFKSITKVYIRGAIGCIVVTDIT